MLRVFNRVVNTPWALTSDALTTMLEIAERQNMSPEAVAQQLGRELNNTYSVEVRDGVAIVPITGPLFRYANLFTALSGATSYELLARDFYAAVQDPALRAIILNIDSPGGEVNGVNELADQIYAARGSKPIVAYVGGMAASGGYWLASAADEIVVDETAELGSIGVRAVLTDTSKRDADAGVKRYSIVSSQSPKKDIDPASADDRARVQALIDELASVFVGRVARNRGVTTDKVLADFGGGDVFIARRAIEAGMADRLGSFEGLVAELSGSSSTVFTPAAARGHNTNGNEGLAMTMYLTNEPAANAERHEVTADAVAQHCPDVAEALRKEGAAQVQGEQAAAVEQAKAEAASGERERIGAILGHEAAKGREQTAQHLALNTDMGVEQAVALLEKTPKAHGGNGFLAAMAGEENPDVGADAGAEGGDPTEADAAKQAIEAARKAGLIS